MQPPPGAPPPSPRHGVLTGPPALPPPTSSSPLPDLPAASMGSEPVDTHRVPTGPPPTRHSAGPSRLMHLALVPGPLQPSLHRTCPCSRCPVSLQEVRVPTEGARAQAPEAGGRRPEEPSEGREVPEGLPGEVQRLSSLLASPPVPPLTPPPPTQGSLRKWINCLRFEILQFYH